MDDEDIEEALARMDRGRVEEPEAPLLGKTFRPPDRDFAERMFKMFARPFDPNWKMPNLDGPEFRQSQTTWVDPRDVRRQGGGQDFGGGFGDLKQYDYDNGPGQGDAGAGVQPTDWNLTGGSKGGTGNGPQVGVWGSMPSRGPGSNRQDGWTLYGQSQEEEPSKYRQIWYDKNVWNAPEVQNATTREEREAAINRIIASQGEGLMRHYYHMHGNENDAEAAKNNDVKYILDAMGGTNEQNQEVNVVKNLPPQIAGGDHLGYLSAKKESDNNPGEISTGDGDRGGKSYGAFQFASNEGVPGEFMKWLATNKPDVYSRLQAAYESDGNNHGANFDVAWRQIAKENPDGFLKMQYDFTRKQYYDDAAAAIKEQTGFDFNTRGYALKNVLWSRAVHHGSGGVVGVVRNALKNVDLNSASDEQIMRAIYAESGSTKDTGGEKEIAITEDTIRASVPPRYLDWYLKIARDNNLLGKYTKYYSYKNSAQQQISVWNRLNNEELPEAIDLHKKHSQKGKQVASPSD